MPGPPQYATQAPYSVSAHAPAMPETLHGPSSHPDGPTADSADSLKRKRIRYTGTITSLALRIILEQPHCTFGVRAIVYGTCCLLIRRQRQKICLTHTLIITREIKRNSRAQDSPLSTLFMILSLLNALSPLYLSLCTDEKLFSF